MAKRCELTGVGAVTGHNVSHSNVKTNRRFLPNLREVSLKSDTLGVNITLKICSKTLRTINKYGSLDSFLINYGFNKLSDEGKVLRTKVKKSLVSKKSLDKVKIKSEKKAVTKKERKNIVKVSE